MYYVIHSYLFDKNKNRFISSVINKQFLSYYYREWSKLQQTCNIVIKTCQPRSTGIKLDTHLLKCMVMFDISVDWGFIHSIY